MRVVGVTGGIGSGKSTVCQLFAQLGVPVYDCDARARALVYGSASTGATPDGVISEPIGVGVESVALDGKVGAATSRGGGESVTSGDEVASAVVTTAEAADVRGQVLQLFGTLDRAEIARKVFADSELLGKLNAIVHPAVRRDFEAWAAGCDARLRAARPCLSSEAESRNAAKPDSTSGAEGGAVDYVVLESAILFESGFNELTDCVIAVSAPLEIRVRRVMERDGVTQEQVMQRVARQMTDEERAARADYEVCNSLDVNELRAQVRRLDELFSQAL